MEREANEIAPYCSLDRKALGERIAMIRRDLLPHATRSEALSDGRAWSFPGDPDLKARLEHLVALERECCGEGITFDLVEGAADDLRLEVRGIDPNAAVFRAIGNPGRIRGLGRLFKAGASGLLLSFALFCVAPWIAVALFGAAVAGPLLALDQPWVVAAGAVFAALGLWLLWWRRGRRASLETR